MRSEAEYLAEYAKSHQNHTNLFIHLLCVPAIFASTMALLWFVPVGRFIPGVPVEWVAYVNAATVGLPFVLGFYAMLSRRALLVGSVWLVLSFALTLAGVSLSLPVVWIAVAVWVVAWLVQFYGHKVEGAKPSFADDSLFLLIGPLFVQQKLNRLLTTGSWHSAAH
jgi:uncharacterized membrane protein YGL010W